ncbi:MAG: TonB C-terminal domain-containing protein [Gemmatimonadota bacterium]|nr:TonB C-terminal domain-containing protein [Gemmatimonadota bacterium]
MNALPAPQSSLTLPIISSAVLHVAALSYFLVGASGATRAQPPMYQVQLIAAPAGPRAEGAVTDAPAPAAPTKAPAAPETKRTLDTKAGPRTQKQAKAATPNLTAKSTPVASKAPPKAGGGPEGGKGTDVANVNTVGIAFPFPGYLTNIVRQIALQFEAPRNAATLTADVTFLVRRDGTVSGIRLLKTSGAYAFDQSCLAAVEVAGKSGKFGPLPAEFPDDVLPVIFSFDPKILR